MVKFFSFSAGSRFSRFIFIYFIFFVGAAIFFEFKHYKPKKKFTSTKCFAFMEMDEIKPGPIVIEL